MEQHDFYVEFYEELDKRLEHFFDFAESGRACVSLAGFPVKEALRTYLFYRLSIERTPYDRCRRQGMGVEDAMSRVDAFLDRLQDATPAVPEDTGEDVRVEVWEHPWKDALEACRGCLLVYVFNARQLQALVPLLERMERPVVLLSEYDIPDDTDLPEYVTALSVEFSPWRIFADRDFEIRFPLFFHYAHAFSILLQLMRPAGIVCLEGCHFQEQLLALEAGSLDIPSYGVQQGWPSPMHTGFRGLPFRYYYTWGKRFSNLWKAHNPVPCFIPAGYMHEVEDCQSAKESHCVAVFLQPTVCLNDDDYLEQLLEMTGEAAKRWPEVTFLVCEHPEYRLDERRLRALQSLGRVEIVSDTPLGQVYARSRIVVSHSSSSLMEGLLYGCRPLVFGPTWGSRYYPDVEKENLGSIARTQEECLDCLSRMLEDGTPPAFRREEWFAATGTTALDAMVAHLNQTMQPL